VFDGDAGDRKAAGSDGGQLFRDAEDPNVVYILFKWDLDQAREYGQSESLAREMQEAGDTGPPEIFFMNEIEKLSSGLWAASYTNKSTEPSKEER
jgi:hypothetical protein